MALHEEHNGQQQRYWQSRTARERSHLSSSVEEALVDTPLQEIQWDDGQHQAGNTSRTGLIPPRLSLQSKITSAVQPLTHAGVKAMTMGTVSAPPETPSLSPDDQEGQLNLSAIQPSPLLMRLAQRITSSLAAFNVLMQSEDYSVPLLPASRPEAGREAVQSQRTAPSPVVRTGNVLPEERRVLPRATVIEAIPASALPITQPVQSQQRITGPAAKIRLQTAPAPALAVTMESANPEAGEVTAPLPALSSRNSVVEDIRHTMYFGSSVFESGSCDVMVLDSHVVESSVIHVTLTTNPGPTVVQYVSLHPQLGFTVHLTAPAAAKTSFNYAVLSGA